MPNKTPTDGEIVEAMARGIMLARDNGGCIVQDWQKEAKDNPHVAQALRQAQAALAAQRAMGLVVLQGWQPIESAPVACHVLAARLDYDVGEWVMGVVASPPSKPFTHWMPLPAPPIAAAQGEG